MGDVNWANESLRIALQHMQDVATKPLHVEIESLRSRLAAADTLLGEARSPLDQHLTKACRGLLQRIDAHLAREKLKEYFK